MKQYTVNNNTMSLAVRRRISVQSSFVEIRGRTNDKQQEDYLAVQLHPARQLENMTSSHKT